MFMLPLEVDVHNWRSIMLDEKLYEEQV